MERTFWEEIPQDCKKAIGELKRLKAHKLAGYDHERTFADVWWCILHEVDLYADGEYCSEDMIAEGFPEEAKYCMNRKQAQRADEWLIRWCYLFDKYKDTEEFGETPFGYTGQI